MKKFLHLMLMLVLIVTLSACTEEPNDEEPKDEGPITISLNRVYEGMDFFRDGIAEATSFRCIDGDTTVFTVNNREIRLRYLGIDTPESSGEFEPWGKEATDWVCQILNEAETIVLEAEIPGQTDSTSSQRHLGYVWVDGELLNLLIILEGFSFFTGSGDLIYADVMQRAADSMQGSGIHVFGQEDPRFSNVREIDLATLLADIDEYLHAPIHITLTVVSHNTTRRGIMVTDDSTNDTVFLYYGFGQVSHFFNVPGSVLRFEELVPTYFNNSFQLTNYDVWRTTCVDNCE